MSSIDNKEYILSKSSNPPGGTSIDDMFSDAEEKAKTALSKDLTKLKKEKANLKKTKEALTAQITSLTNTYNNLSSTLEAKQNMYKTNKKKITSLESEINTLTASGKLTTKKKEQIAKYQSEISKLKSTNSTLKNEVENLKIAVEPLKDQITQLQNQSDSVTLSYKKVLASIKKLEEQVTTETMEAPGLNEEDTEAAMTDYENKIRALKSEIKSLNTELEFKKEIIAECNLQIPLCKELLKGLNESLKKEKDENSKQYIKNQIQETEQRLSMYRDRLNAAAAEINAIDGVITNKNAELEQIQEKYNKLAQEQKKAAAEAEDTKARNSVNNGITFGDTYDNNGNYVPPTNRETQNLLTNSGTVDSQKIYHPANLYLEKDLDIYHERYRYGVLNAYTGVTDTREFLFFTKPDLNLVPTGDKVSNIKSISKLDPEDMNGVLIQYPFWIDLCNRYPGVVECLQSGLHLKGRNDPFNHLLENMVQSTIDVPSLSAELMETPANMYGVNYTYRGSSEASDDGFDFSLEFKETKFLDVYNFFKAYEEYETLKHHGVIGPWIGYTERKVLHDQYSIYKFVVGEDRETLLYWAKYYGVKSKSLPRDVFNSNTFDNGLSYSIDFNAAFVEDMNPQILADFNALSYKLWKEQDYNLEVHDMNFDLADNRPARCAIIVREENGKKDFTLVGSKKTVIKDPINSEEKKLTKLKNHGGYCYKIKWRGGKEA